MRLFELLRRTPAFCYWSMRTLRLHRLGRLYVFRDAPDWWVYEIATSTIKPKDDFTRSYIQEAIKEVVVRLTHQFSQHGLKVKTVKLVDGKFDVTLSAQ